MQETTISTDDQKYAVRTALDERFALTMEQLGLTQNSSDAVWTFYAFDHVIHVKWTQEYERSATFQVAGHPQQFIYRFLEHDEVKKIIQLPKKPFERIATHVFPSWSEGERDIALTIIRLLTEAEQSIGSVAAQARNQTWRYEPAS